jgi:replication factor A2
MDYQGGSSQGGFGNGGFGGESSQGSGNRGGGRKSYDEQTLQPCTIGMILSALPEGNDSGSLELSDGRKLHHVVIVGAVKECTQNSTNALYEIEDGTGLIVVKQWVDQNDCAAKYEMRQKCMHENTYLKIVGSPKYYDGNVQLVAESIRPVSTGNELTHHMLEVAYAGEKYKNRHSLGVPRQPLSSGVGFGSSGPALTRKDGGEGGILETVRNHVRNEGEKMEMGAHISDIITQLGRQYTEPMIRKAIEDLAAEGHIYSTINEDYYKFAM